MSNTEVGLCHVHVRIAGTAVGTAACPACATMVRLAGELDRPGFIRGKAGGQAFAAKKQAAKRRSMSPWRQGQASVARVLVPAGRNPQ